MEDPNTKWKPPESGVLSNQQQFKEELGMKKYEKFKAASDVQIRLVIIF